MNRFYLIAYSIFFLISARGQTGLPEGIWRGELQRSDGKVIVTNFEVSRANDSPAIFILNAEERLKADDIRVEGDSVFIKLPFFDSQFRLKLEGGSRVSGKWIKTLADRDVVLPFTAQNNQPYRFKITSGKPPVNVAGRWAATFTDTVSGRSTPSVGIFAQSGNRLTGSFLTPYGDYRYLEGVVDGDSLKLSGFDGGYALLFTAKVGTDGSIHDAGFFSGAGPATQKWQAVKDPQAALPDAAAVVHVREGAEPRLDFTFKDSDGVPVSIKEDRFRNKVVIVQILGSWCPNCLDETAFLVDLYNEHKEKGLEVIGLAYERTEDFARSQAAVRNFMRRLKVNYPVLITPVAVGDPLRVEKTLPQIDNIPAFPTSIFIGRDGKIAVIHAGFSGPATGREEYEKQKKEYYHIVEELLSR